MLWKVRTHTLNLSRRSLLMGVLNVTPDSFSDGGRWGTTQQAISAALSMAEGGADLIDVGGESSRPGATPVPVDEELRRVLPVIEALSASEKVLISIDTCKAEVAYEALKAGACVVNDITGLQEPEMRRVVQETGAGAIVMHMRGTPATMQQAPRYSDVVVEVRSYLSDALLACSRDGIDPDQVLLDPGIGFGKSSEHNLMLLSRLPELRQAGRPLALGVSRKSFLASLTRCTSMEERLWPTVALGCFARSRGVALLRVHDITPNSHALRVTETILEDCA